MMVRLRIVLYIINTTQRRGGDFQGKCLNRLSSLFISKIDILLLFKIIFTMENLNKYT